MRLDSIPAALRDLSNQLAPAPAPASASTPTHRPRSSLVKTPVSAGRRPRNSAAKARRARTPRSPCGGDRDSDGGVAPLPPSPAPTLPPRLPPARPAPSRPPCRLAPAPRPSPFPRAGETLLCPSTHDEIAGPPFPLCASSTRRCP
ncbi:Protein of unknown function [Gryllus bimaculatus]|nr:Protein of unknown function [Gryllus bimaculatus]